MHWKIIIARGYRNPGGFDHTISKKRLKNEVGEGILFLTLGAKSKIYYIFTNFISSFPSFSNCLSIGLERNIKGFFYDLTIKLSGLH